MVARKASLASLTSASFVTANSKRQKLVLQPARMDWSGPKTCRPSYYYSLSKFATCVIAVGVLGMAVAYLNDRIRQSLHTVADVTTDIHELQHEVHRMREILEGKAERGEGFSPHSRKNYIKEEASAIFPKLNSRW